LKPQRAALPYQQWLKLMALKLV